MKGNYINKIVVAIGAFIAVFFAVNLNAQENKDYPKLVAQINEAIYNNDIEQMKQLVAGLDLNSQEEQT